MRAIIFASSSAGNACLFETTDTRILVDAGLSLRQLERKLEDADVRGPVDALVITHAHRDHVGECAAIGRHLGVPVYATESTARTARLGDRKRVRVCASRGSFRVGSLSVSTLPLPHDVHQVALRVDDGTHTIGLATDLGEVPADLRAHFDECDALLLESNHDVHMLETGPYSADLKKRVASSKGHLSNEQCARFLADLSARTRVVVLMHLSEKNNRPELALERARAALAGRNVQLSAACPDDLRVVHAARAL